MALQEFDSDAFFGRSEPITDIQQPEEFDSDSFFGRTAQAPEQAPIEAPVQAPVQVAPEQARANNVQQQQTALADKGVFDKSWETIKRGNARSKLLVAIADAEDAGETEGIEDAMNAISTFDKQAQTDPVGAESTLGEWWYSAMNSLGGGMLKTMLVNAGIEAVALGATALAVNVPDPTDAATAPATWLATTRALRGAKWVKDLMKANKGAKVALELGRSAKGIEAAYKTARTINGLTKLSQTAVTTAIWAKQGKGTILKELIGENIDPKIRGPIANIGGFIYGGIENFGAIHKLNPVTAFAEGQLAKITTATVKKAVMKAVTQYGIEVVKESFEESLQEQTTQSAYNLAIKAQIEQDIMDGMDEELSNAQFKIISGGEQLSRDWEAFKGSLGPMAILGGFGAAPNIAGAAISTRNQQKASEAGATPSASGIPDSGAPLFTKETRDLFAEQSTEEAQSRRRDAFAKDKAKLGDAEIVEDSDPAIANPNAKAMVDYIRTFSAQFSGKDVVLFKGDQELNGKWTANAVYINAEQPETWMMRTFLHEGVSHEIYQHSQGRIEDGARVRTPEQQELASTLQSVIDYIEDTDLYEDKIAELKEDYPDRLDPFLNEEFRGRLFETFATDPQFQAKLASESPALFAKLMKAMKEFFKKMKDVILAAENDSGGLLQADEVEQLFGGNMVKAKNAMILASQQYLASNRGGAEADAIATAVEALESGVDAEVKEEATEETNEETLDYNVLKGSAIHNVLLDRAEELWPSESRKDLAELDNLAGLIKAREVLLIEAKRLFPNIPEDVLVGSTTLRDQVDNKRVDEKKEPLPHDQIVDSTLDPNVLKGNEKRLQKIRDKQKGNEKRLQKIRDKQKELGVKQATEKTPEDMLSAIEKSLAGTELTKDEEAFVDLARKQGALPPAEKKEATVKQKKARSIRKAVTAEKKQVKQAAKENAALQKEIEKQNRLSEGLAKRLKVESQAKKDIAESLEITRKGQISFKSGEKTVGTPREEVAYMTRRTGQTHDDIVQVPVAGLRKTNKGNWIGTPLANAARTVVGKLKKFTGGVWSVHKEAAKENAKTEADETWFIETSQRMIDRAIFNKAAIPRDADAGRKNQARQDFLEEATAGHAALDRMFNKVLISPEVKKQSQIDFVKRNYGLYGEGGELTGWQNDLLTSEEIKSDTIPSEESIMLRAALWERGVYAVSSNAMKDEAVRIYRREQGGIDTTKAAVQTDAGGEQSIEVVDDTATKTEIDSEQIYRDIIINNFAEQVNAKTPVADTSELTAQWRAALGEAEAKSAEDADLRVELMSAYRDLVGDTSMESRALRDPEAQTAIRTDEEVAKDAAIILGVRDMNAAKDDLDASYTRWIRAAGSKYKGAARAITDAMAAAGYTLEQELINRGSRGDRRKSVNVRYEIVQGKRAAARALSQSRGRAANKEALTAYLNYLTTFESKAMAKNGQSKAIAAAHSMELRVNDALVDFYSKQGLSQADAVSKAIEAADKIFATEVGPPSPDTILDPRKQAEYIREVSIVTATGYDMALEWWRSMGLLSGMQTLVQNPVSNAVRLLYEFGPKGVVSAGIKTALGKKGEFKALSASWNQLMGATAWKHSMKAAMETLRTEIPRLMRGEFGQKLDASSKHHSIPGKIGQLVRGPYRVLSGADEFFKMMTLQSFIAAEIARDSAERGINPSAEAASKRLQEVVNNPDDPMFIAGIEKALEYTWQNKPIELAQGVINLRQNVKGAEFALPFVTTPMNILTQGLRMSPLGVINMARKSIKGEYWKGLDKNFDRTAFADDLAEQALAWGTMGVIAGMMGDPDDPDKEVNITGGQPSYRFSPRGQAGFEKNAMPPMHIKIGKYMLDYSRIEPIATILPPIIDSIRLYLDLKKGRDKNEAMGDAFVRTAMAMSDKTFTGSISDLTRAIDDPAQLPKLAQNFAVSWIPNAIRSTARAYDDFERDQTIKGKRLSGEWITDLSKKGLFRTFPIGDKGAFAPKPKVDLWGKDIKKSGAVDSVNTDTLQKALEFAGVAKVRESRINDLDRMIINWNVRARYEKKNFKKDGKYNDAEYPQKPRRYISEGRTKLGKGKNLYLNDKQYHQYAKMIGEMTFNIASKQKFNIDNPSVRDIVRLKNIRKRATSLAGKRMRIQIRKNENE